MTRYYRAEQPHHHDWYKKGVLKGHKLYDDGESNRPAGCINEVAFADSIGGAIYGSLQNKTAAWGSEPGDIHRALGNDMAIDGITVYYTEEEPDYVVGPSSMENMQGTTTDFQLTGEVRYCNREVPVKHICTCPITRHDYAVAQSLIYKDWQYEHFAHKDPWIDTDYDPIEEEETLHRIIAGDQKTIAKYRLDEPVAKDEEHSDLGDGFNEMVVYALIDSLGKRCMLELD